MNLLKVWNERDRFFGEVEEENFGPEALACRLLVEKVQLEETLEPKQIWFFVCV